MAYPSRVTLYEVGPRDGLQNESARLPVEAKLRLIVALADTGLSRIEIGSFVRPDWIPQLADTDQVAQRLPRRSGLRYSALVPNRTGLERAVTAGLREVAVFMSSSEAHNQKNTNKSIAQSLAHFGDIVPAAKAQGLFVRAYLSTVWGCPYEGPVDPRRALEISRQLRAIGCDEISLGDTITSATRCRPGASSSCSSTAASRPRASRCTCTTPTAPRSPTAWSGWTWASAPSTPASGAWAAVPMRPARPETWPPKISRRCWPAWASRPASISRSCSPPASLRKI